VSIRNDVIKGIIDAMAAGLADGTDSFGAFIKKVTPMNQNLLTSPSFELPAVIVTDTGGEEITSRGADSTAYIALIECRCLVNESTIEATISKLNDVSGAVKNFIESTNTWHARCLHVSCSGVVGFRVDDNILGYAGAGESTLTLSALYYRNQGEA
jgi:hypothetical protein